jgi:hypothetical protein
MTAFVRRQQRCETRAPNSELSGCNSNNSHDSSQAVAVFYGAFNSIETFVGALSTTSTSCTDTPVRSCHALSLYSPPAHRQS